MSLSRLNVTQQADVLTTLYGFTASSTVPLLLVESFLIGVLCSGIPLASYMLWVRKRFPSRTAMVFALWSVLLALITHWAFSLRQLEAIISGRAMRITLTLDAFPATGPELDATTTVLSLPGNLYAGYGFVWQSALPLVTETVLFGFTSVLMMITVGTLSRQSRARRPSRFAMIIPGVAGIMFALSLAHWICSLGRYSMLTKKHGYDLGYDVGPTQAKDAILGLLSGNVFLSDTIVLWRMCIVWNKKRSVLIFGAMLTLANVILTVMGCGLLNSGSYIVTLSELVQRLSSTSVYGSGAIGLAVALTSLGCNLCATTLVGLRVWLHRRQLREHASFHGRRTLALRVMELLAESGIVYTAIWGLYCVSFFQPVTDYAVQYDAEGVPDLYTRIDAANHLDAAMAQITCIYPLMVFILIALDKIHYARGPDVLCKPDDVGDKRAPALSRVVTSERDAESGDTLNSTLETAYPMLILGGTGTEPPRPG